jgi:hypothetical protein
MGKFEILAKALELLSKDAVGTVFFANDVDVVVLMLGVAYGPYYCYEFFLCFIS